MGFKTFRRVTVGLVLALLILQAESFGKELVTQHKGMQVNWSKQRVFFEYSLPFSKGVELTMKQKVEQVTKAALRSMIRPLETFHFSQYATFSDDLKSLEKKSKIAARSMNAKTWVQKGLLFQDGRIGVRLESYMPYLFPEAPKPQRGERPKASDTNDQSFSGFVFRVDREVEPRVVWKLVDETGRLLFGRGMVGREHWKKRLMGRWLLKPTPKELRDMVGSKPLSVAVRAKSSGVFEVSSRAWNSAISGRRHLLEAAKVVILQP